MKQKNVHMSNFSNCVLLKVVTAFIMLACPLFVNAQSYCYQKVQDSWNGVDQGVSASEKVKKCITFYGNNCKWDDEYVESWRSGVYSKEPIVYTLLSSNNGNYVYQFRASGWSKFLSVSSDFSVIVVTTSYPETGQNHGEVFNRVE